MPIIGVTDKESLGSGRYPLVGTLNKGDIKPERGAGRELPYFRFSSDNPGAVAAFEAAFGKQPKQLRAYLPSATADDCFSTWIEAWMQNNRMLWRSNGETSVRRWLEDKKAYSDRAVDQLPHDQLPRQDLASWKGRLNLFFPELLEAGFPGVVMLGTSGKHDIGRISRALAKLETDCAYRPDGIKGVEVVIERREVKRPDPDGTKRSHYDVFLFPAEEWVIAALEAARQEMLNLLPATVSVAGRTVDTETGEVLDDPDLDYDGEVLDDEPEPPAPSPAPAPKAKPAPSPTPKPEPKANGAPMASISGCKEWRTRASQFCADHEGWDFPRILRAAFAAGVETVTDENLDATLAAIAKAIQEVEAEPEQGTVPF